MLPLQKISLTVLEIYLNKIIETQKICVSTIYYVIKKLKFCV